MRDRGLALLGDDQPPALGLRADLGERQRDRARFALRDAVENREIALFDLPLLKGPAKPAQRLGIARQQQTARSVGVEPVHRRSEEHTSELQSLMRISYAVFCLKKKKKNNHKRQ